MSDFFHDPEGYIQRNRQDLDESLWTQEMQGLENRVDPEISDGIVDVVTDLVNNYGSVSADGVYKVGSFLVRSEAIPGQADKVPTLNINIPVEGERFGWLAEMILEMQDQKLSQHVLVNKDATIRVSGYDGRPDTFMSKVESVHFLDSLKKLSAEIKEDLS
jgi:hypothetical protein